MTKRSASSLQRCPTIAPPAPECNKEMRCSTTYQWAWWCRWGFPQDTSPLLLLIITIGCLPWEVWSHGKHFQLCCRPIVSAEGCFWKWCVPCDHFSKLCKPEYPVMHVGMSRFYSQHCHLSSVLSWMTVSCFWLFVCILNVISTLSANSSSSDCVGMRCPFLKKRMFWRRKRFVRFNFCIFAGPVSKKGCANGELCDWFVSFCHLTFLLIDWGLRKGGPFVVFP